jgi:hypothetical protein
MRKDMMALDLGKTDKTGGISLDLGLLQLEITLSITGIRSLSDAIRQTLQEAQPTLRQNVNKVVDVVSQLGVEELRKWARQGGQEERGAFNQLVTQLQAAALRGEDEAGKLLQKLGGKISETGEKMQTEESGTRH